MRLNVFGLVSIDTIEFNNGLSYIGGGALATAWVASLWKVPSTLYSISCGKEYQQKIQKNVLWNKDYFSHSTLSASKQMVRFEIFEDEGDYTYKIYDLDDVKEELKKFLEKTGKEQYLKLPACNLIDFANKLTISSFNPQGRYNLFELTKQIHTDGFIFLNRCELLMNSNLSFLLALKYIESSQQSYVITLGKEGAICYYANDRVWCFCPAVQSEPHINTLGCGDAFAGGFLAAFMKYSAIAESMILGTISAYLVTYAPSNMVTVWLETISEADIFNKLLSSIEFFDTADKLIQYLHFRHDECVTWNISSYLINKFDWKLN